ncbi:MAG: hypothetical protein JW795_15400, partial [Chitinivibrionales bacterium]|nr:hypothetical protein [Chitinivibrionales bacterium]
MRLSNGLGIIFLCCGTFLFMRCNTESNTGGSATLDYLGSWMPINVVQQVNVKIFIAGTQIFDDDTVFTETFPNDTSGLLKFENSLATFYDYEDGDTVYYMDTSAYTLGAGNVLYGDNFTFSETTDTTLMSTTVSIQSASATQMVMIYTIEYKSWSKDLPTSYTLTT